MIEIKDPIRELILEETTKWMQFAVNAWIEMAPK